jgi:hypothetical protein
MSENEHCLDVNGRKTAKCLIIRKRGKSLKLRNTEEVTICIFPNVKLCVRVMRSLTGTTVLRVT